MKNRSKQPPVPAEKLATVRRMIALLLHDGEDIRFQDGLQTKIEDGAELTILPAVAGG